MFANNLKHKVFFCLLILMCTESIFQYLTLVDEQVQGRSYEAAAVDKFTPPSAKPLQMLTRHNETWLVESLKQSLKKASRVKMKMILWEIPFGNYRLPSIDIENCGFCEVTFDKAEIESDETKAVIFHFGELYKTTIPKRRKQDQFYVFMSMESTSTLVSHLGIIRKYDDLFNLSMTYRSDSDIWVPYGNKKSTMEQPDKRPPSIKHRKLGLWVVSNCEYTRGAIERMKYMMSLKRDGLEIDYGGYCFPGGVKKWEFDDYKFYFAFENSVHCKDYITEKFFHNALGKGVVPVVFGAYKADYERVAPPGSFIYAQDYTNKELIDLLHYLDRNETAYMEYFDWRRESVFDLYERHSELGYCRLCRLLHGINFDYIFNRDYSKNHRNLNLFVDKPQRRTIPSISKWLLDNESEDCKTYAFTTTTRVLYQVNKYHFPIILLFLIVFFFFWARSELHSSRLCRRNKKR